MNTYVTKYRKYAINYLYLNNIEIININNNIEYLNDEEIKIPKFILYEGDKLLLNSYHTTFSFINTKTFETTSISHEDIKLENVKYLNKLVFKNYNFYLCDEKQQLIILNPKLNRYLYFGKYYKLFTGVVTKQTMEITSYTNIKKNIFIVK